MKALRVLFVLLLACGGDNIQKQKDPDPIPEPKCGDGLVTPDLGEQCDGSDLGGNSCTGLGFDLGTVSCDAQCRIVTSQCVKLCGDGKIGPGEECDGAAGSFACADWGYKACNASCKVDALHCKSASFSAKAPFALAPGGVSILADTAPAGFGDLITAVPGRGRLETHEWNPTLGFDVQRRRTLNSSASGIDPFLPISGDLDGDGHLDLAAINTDGTVERYLYVPATPTAKFAVEPIALSTDGGTPCRIGAWVGGGALDDSPGADFAALGCESFTATINYDSLFIFSGSAQLKPPLEVPLPLMVLATLADDNGDGLQDVIALTKDGNLAILNAPTFTPGTPIPFGGSATSMAAGDLDGDGDADLVLASGPGLVTLENTGGAFVQKRSEMVAPSQLLVRDLDLDGKPDVAWMEMGKVQVRRNIGAFTFTPYEYATGAGIPFSLAAGDLEGDGDPDLVATMLDPMSLSNTTVHVLQNAVR